jgi:hypothetical protein
LEKNESSEWRSVNQIEMNGMFEDEQMKRSENTSNDLENDSKEQKTTNSSVWRKTKHAI